MKRRTFLGAAAATLAAPSLPRAQAARTLKFIPHANLTVVDPIWTTAYVSRNHGFLVWDTLYGLDEQYRPQPQMVEGHTVENDGKLWTFTLREGLRFHDGEPVRARDCVASIARWAKRDAMGARLAALTDEMVALDDRRFRIRLKRPFGLMLDALAKPPSNVCFIMPERVAETDAFTQIRPEQIIGSGPFTFKRDEFVAGSRVVYERFAGYQPRAGGTASGTAGPKVVHFDRVEWHIIPDFATAAAAIQSGEVDWWENLTADHIPILSRNRNVNIFTPDPLGSISILRPNFLTVPTNNKLFRQALLRAVNQADYMAAVMGADPKYWKTGVGVFTPGTPLATDVGLDAMKGDLNEARRLIRESGYNGERIVLLATTDIASLVALSQVTGDLLRRLGLNVDYQAMDWGTVVQRRASREPIDRGGWNIFCTNWAGLDHINPAGHHAMRGSGAQAWPGWPDIPRIEELREAWFDAPDLEAQKRIAAEIQKVVLEEVPYIPLGQFFQPLAHRRSITGVMQPFGIPVFWNVRRA
ncbi:ABC transporter substrate-binding protein [Elioraea thermophila]|uniref:ABC transporter substrate-binding protein n=1 Tax=Elioraea thermophila TaxID=2185104 RepID=UPI000DF2252F|nr:ABC transporter substrate-binding protein [Elioraea thermophila]